MKASRILRKRSFLLLLMQRLATVLKEMRFGKRVLVCLLHHEKKKKTTTKLMMQWVDLERKMDAVRVWWAQQWWREQPSNG
jgi:hypothetical protein